MKTFENLCKCGHAEGSHSGLRLMQDNQMLPSNKIHDCRVDNFDCKDYDIDKKICIYCKQEFKNDGPIAKGMIKDNPAGGSIELDDYCLTNGCPNFKYKKD